MSQDRLFNSQQSQRRNPARSRQQRTKPPAAPTPSRYISYPELRAHISGSLTTTSVQDSEPYQPQPTNAHTPLRARYYYGTQELRPNEPVFTRPSVEDILRRQRRSGIRERRLYPRLREAPGRFQFRLADMEDVTSVLRPTLPSRNNDTKNHEPDTDNGENILGEKYEMVKHDIELTEDFEEVDKHFPSDFNGKRPR